MKKRNLVIFGLTVIIAASTFVGIYYNITQKSSVNLSGKIVGSKLSSTTLFNRDAAKSVGSILEYADLVAIIKVIDNGITHKIKLPYAKDGYTSDLTFTEVNIEEVLYGSVDTRVITLTQMGQAGKDEGETKVKMGELFLMMLHKNEYGYNSVGLEEGLFKIDNVGKVFSLSDNPALCKYDGRNLRILKEDILRVKK